MNLVDKFKGTYLPKNLGEAADLLKDVQQLRLAMQRDVEAWDKYESAIEEHLIAQLDSRNEGGAAGQRYMAKVKVSTKPVIGEGKWPDFLQFVRTSGRFDLLQKRLSDKAVMDMVEQGETPPGVEKFNAKKISLTKL